MQIQRSQTQFRKEDSLSLIKKILMTFFMTADVSDDVAQELQMSIGTGQGDADDAFGNS